MNTSIPRLILHPKDEHYMPDSQAHIFEQLKVIHLIDKPMAEPGYFSVGSGFTNLLTFLGCSPNINTGPDQGENFCSIYIPDSHEQSTLLGYTNMVIPACPNCKHKIKDWRQHFHEWKHADTIYNCSECETSIPVSQLKWRQEGGYGRYCISINHIHPHEAVPSDKLLDTLQQASKTEWTYFYANN